MAAQKNNPAPKKQKPSFGARLDDRLQKLLDGFDDLSVQTKNGSHRRRLRRILRRVSRLPEGKKMLAAAEKNGVKIQVLRPNAMKGAAGKLTRYSKSNSVVSIANNGDEAQMTLTLWHELRHVQQMHDWGRLAPGNTGRLQDTQRMHILSMMIEADAYTAQTLMSIKVKQAGDSTYYDALMRRNSRAFKTVKAFLDKTPYESFSDDGAFSRALFVEIMQKGLNGYSLSYQKNYAQIFNRAASVKTFRATVKNMKKPPPFLPSDDILGVYRSDPKSSTVLSTLVGAHLQAQPKKLQQTLKIIDKTVEAAPKLPEESYQKIRSYLLARLPAPTPKAPDPTPLTRLRGSFNALAQKLNPARFFQKKSKAPPVKTPPKAPPKP